MTDIDPGGATRPADADAAIGALLAVALIGLVRGLPRQAETKAAEGDAVPG